MLNSDPYAVMRALLRAEAVRNTPKPRETKPDARERQQPPKERKHG